MDIRRGNNANNGLTPQTPVQTIANAYSKLPSAGTVNSNIIVIMGNYTDTAYLNTAGTFANGFTNSIYNKPVGITGMYKGINYNGELAFSGAKYLVGETVYQYMSLNGNNAATNFYLQGKKMTFGEQVKMINYPNINMASDEMGLLKGSGNSYAAPDFNVYGGGLFRKQEQVQNMNFPFNSTELIIKSGTFARIVARKYF